MLTIFRYAFAGLLLVKVLDIAERGRVYLGLPLAALICLVWVVAAVAIARDWHGRAAAVAIAVLAVAVPVLSGMEMYNQHMYLIGSIAVVLALRAAEATLLKAQLSIVYGFGVLAKLNEAFLSGTEVYTSAIARPFWMTFIDYEPSATIVMAASVAALCTEGGLAIALWLPRARWVAAPVGVAFHTVMLVLMTAGPISFVRLLVFGFLLVALYLPFFERELDGLMARRGRRSIRRTLDALPA